MSKEQYAPIRFQLEESIWLDHHANAAEILSLELEPDVEVVEERNFVTIAGSLVLRGRFDTRGEAGDDSLDLESSSLAEQLHYQPLRVEQKEIYEEDFRGRIEKVFPVDVTVPLNKIDNIDDVFVRIEQLDYTITDGHRLNIQADIEIIGILNEAREEKRVEEEQAQHAQQVKEEAFPDQSFGAPLLPAFDVAASRDENDQYSRETESQLDREQEVDENENENENEIYQTSTQFEVSTDRDEAQAEEEIQSNYQEFTQNERDAEENVIPLFDQEIRTVFHSLPTNDEAVASAPEERGNEEKEEENVRSQTTGFLTQLLSTREVDEEERYTKLKMCIIQRDESLDSISERYAIPIRDIMRVNHLESEQITAGQILYIPKS